MRSYKVGRGKPPKSTRFKKGRSGNPKGRPPKRDHGEDPELDRVLKQKVGASINGRPRKLSTKEAMYQRIASQGIQGDTRAFKALLAMEERNRKRRRPELPKEIDEDELKILKHHFARIQKLVSGDE